MSGNHLHLHAQNILSLLGAKNNVSTKIEGDQFPKLLSTFDMLFVK
jgi:hypothetical protein